MRIIGITVVAGLLIAGCGKTETVVGPDGAKVTTNQNSGTTTYSDNKGNSATVNPNGVANYQNEKGETAQIGGSITEADLGLPFYPGSAEKAGGASMKSDTAEGKSAMAMRTSKDEPDKVVAFYKDKVIDGKDSTVNSGDTKMATLTGKLQDGAQVSVMATKKGTDDTDVVVTVTRKKA